MEGLIQIQLILVLVIPAIYLMLVIMLWLGCIWNDHLPVLGIAAEVERIGQAVDDLIGKVIETAIADWKWIKHCVNRMRPPTH